MPQGSDLPEKVTAAKFKQVMLHMLLCQVCVCSESLYTRNLQSASLITVVACGYMLLYSKLSQLSNAALLDTCNVWNVRLIAP